MFAGAGAFRILRRRATTGLASEWPRPAASLVALARLEADQMFAGACANRNLRRRLNWRPSHWVALTYRPQLCTGAQETNISPISESHTLPAILGQSESMNAALPAAPARPHTDCKLAGAGPSRSPAPAY